MKLAREITIPVPRALVWSALNDPEVLRRCVPGCEQLERISEVELLATVVAKLGPVKPRLQGSVLLSNLAPPSSYTITGRLQGGAAGFAEGSAEVQLRDEGGATVLSYDVKSVVGGKLAQIGSRLVEASVMKLADQFFAALSRELVEQPACAK